MRSGVIAALCITVLVLALVCDSEAWLRYRRQGRGRNRRVPIPRRKPCVPRCRLVCYRIRNLYTRRIERSCRRFCNRCREVKRDEFTQDRDELQQMRFPEVMGMDLPYKEMNIAADAMRPYDEEEEEYAQFEPGKTDV